MNRFHVLQRIGGFAILLIVLVAFFMIGCESTGAGDDDDDGAGTNDDSTAVDDGTVTVSLSGAADLEGDLFAVYMYAHDEYSINTAERLLAVNYATIDASGNADLVLKEDDDNFEPTGTDFVGTGGTTYDMYIYTDSQDDGTIDGTDDYDAATSFRAYRTENHPQTVTIDSDQIVSVARDAMVAYDGGTVTVTLSNATDHNGQWFYYAIYLSGAVGGADDPLAYAEKSIAGGSATGADLRARSEIQDPFYAVDGTSYDLYAIIDMDSTGHSDGITVGDLIYQETFTQSGDDDKTIATDASAFEEYNE